MRIVLIILGVVVGALTLAVFVAFVAWFGADLIPQRAQPLAELTFKLDGAATPAVATRALYPGVRDAVRDSKIGFATIAPSGDSIEVTLHDGVDRAQALNKVRELSHQSTSDHADTERFTIADGEGAVLRLTPTAAAITEATDDQAVAVLSRRLDSLKVKATVRRDGNTVMVDLPRETNTGHLKDTLVAPGKLTIRFIDNSVSIDDARRGHVPPESELLSAADG